MSVPKPLALTTALIAAIVLLCALAVLSDGPDGDALRIRGSTTVNPIVAEAAEILRTEAGMRILVDTQGGSSGGISAIGDGLAEIGMSSKPLAESDRAKYPRVDFRATRIGIDAVALVVSKDVHDAGVRSITREAMRDVYEGRITDWSELGGPARPIAFFNKEPGRGTWEVFAAWLYGSSSHAPSVSFPEVGGNEETRNKVASTPGALSQLSAAWADGERVFALDVETDDGAIVACTPSTITEGTYPMSRPLLLLTDGPPTDAVATFLDFVLGARGQALVRRHGYLALDQLEP